jgi:hypothetical protein
MFKKSTDFSVTELSIVTKNSDIIDIRNIYEEINIFDSIFVPVISGNILISDSLGLSNNLVFDGSEVLLIEISKSPDLNVAKFKKAFRIYKQSFRKNTNLNNEQYILHFVSDELIYSHQQKINQAYEGTYSYIIQKIMEDYLKISQSEYTGIYEKSRGIKKVIIPNLTPIDAIRWCTKRAVDNQESPNFLFYQNNAGYNFASLSNLLTQEKILNIYFEIKNIKGDTAFDEMEMARAMEMVSQSDELERVQKGINAGTFMGFDPMTGMTEKNRISYSDVFNDMKHGNKLPNISVIKNREGIPNINSFNSKKVLNVFSSLAAKQASTYIRKNDPESISKHENYESFIFQRKALIGNLLSRRLKLAMPGNFQLSSGFNVYVSAPNFAKKSLEKSESLRDETASGKYLIVASRQIISAFDKHETVVEVATTSTENPYIAQSSATQMKKLLEY